MHTPTSTAISFALLALVVGGSFAYVSLNTIKEAWLGFSGSDVTPAIAQQIGLEPQRGFLVFIVERGSPAADAGMKGGNRIAVIEGENVTLGGDVIIAVDGTPINGGDDIINLLTPKNIGDTIKLTVVRGNATRDLYLVIGEKPQ